MRSNKLVKQDWIFLPGYVLPIGTLFESSDRYLCTRILSKNGLVVGKLTSLVYVNVLLMFKRVGVFLNP